jgi:hypothetical protein
MEFNSSKGYQTIKTELKTLLADFGFRPYNASILFRVTNESILQFISFQKGVQSLNQQMTINVVLQGLFSPTCSFSILQPGGRIGSFLKPKTDKWWFCDTEKATSMSVFEIKEGILQYLIPFFDRTTTVQETCDLIESKELEFIWANYYTFIDKGFFYLKAKKYDKAIQIFQSNQHSKVPKFKTIKNLIDENNYDGIDKILIANLLDSKTKLTI